MTRTPHAQYHRTTARRASAIALAGSLLLLLPSCGGDQSALDPRGPRADTIASLWWIMLGIATVVFLIVVALVVVAAVRAHRLRREQDAATVVSADDRDIRLITVGGIIIPAVILVTLFVFTLLDMSALSAPEGDAQDMGLTIEVTAHQWWWEFHYPEAGFTTANEIHIPTGEPVAIELQSDDVIHSFWAPQLQGKLDVIPGKTNTTWLEADEPGEYRGQCAEFCGLQHANMAFIVVAQTQDDYAAWLAGQQQPAPQPADALLTQGEQVFLGSSCVYCHTIDGTAAKGIIAPDLTHIATRMTLASGTMANNQGNLAGWILDPQHFKPGTQMPPTQLDPADFQALLAYLESLK